MTEATIWNQLFVWPITNLLMVMYKGFSVAGVPGAFGFAIIAMTVAMRILLSPLMRSQMVSSRKMATLKPKMDELSRKFKNDKKQLQQAQLDLYKQEGINPAAGCVPMLLQLPLLFALYGVFNQIFGATDTQKLLSDMNAILYSPAYRAETLDLNFFGISLATKPSAWQQSGLWLLSIPVITAVLQWFQTRLMTVSRPMPASTTEKPATPDKAITKKGAKHDDAEKDKPQEDLAADMQKQMAIMTPLMFGMFSFQFPLGLSMYWNTFTVFGILQQYLVNKEVTDR